MAITSATAANLTPSPVKKALASNYLDFAGGTDTWAQQYLPDTIVGEAEAYGKRTMAGFLAQVGAEESMTSDQVIWSEQGRLHLAYKGHVDASANTGNTVGGVSATNAGGVLEIEQEYEEECEIEKAVVYLAATPQDAFLPSGMFNKIIGFAALMYGRSTTK